MSNLDILNGIALKASTAKEEKEIYVGSWIVDLYPDFRGTKEGLIIEAPTELEGLEIANTLNFGKVKLHILTPRASLLLALNYLPVTEIPSVFGVYCHIFGIESEGQMATQMELEYSSRDEKQQKEERNPQPEDFQLTDEEKAATETLQSLNEGSIPPGMSSPEDEDNWD